MNATKKAKPTPRTKPPKRPRPRLSGIWGKKGKRGGGAIDDTGALRLDGAGNRGLAHARENLLQQLFVYLILPLKVVVIHGVAIELERIGFLGSQGLPGREVVAQRRLVIGLDGGGGVIDRPLQLALGLCEGLHGLDHLRVLVPVALAELGDRDLLRGDLPGELLITAGWQ